LRITHAKRCFRGRIVEHAARRTARLRPIGLRRGSLRYDRLAEPKLASASEGWWSQTGSNRRPHACKARALPAELWPRNQKTNALRKSIINTKFYHARLRPLGFAGHASLYSERGCATRSRRRSVVGLGRLELPTSRLSSARSNQLSYKPLTLILVRGSEHCMRAPGVLRRSRSHKRSAPGACSSAKKEKRRRRNPANGAHQILRSMAPECF
jgi:hypothetical protein